MALFEGKSILLIKKSPVTEHNSSKVKIFPLQHDRSTAILLFDNFSRLCFPCETSTQFPVSRIGHKETRWYTLVHRLWLYLSGNPCLLDIWAANLTRQSVLLITKMNMDAVELKIPYDRAKFARSFSLDAILVHLVVCFEVRWFYMTL